MNLAEEAFQELFPNRTETRKFIVSYSAKFRKLNSNVKYTSDYIHFSLSRDWLEHSEDLRKGMMQHLLLKIFRKYQYEKTIELDLYDKFVNSLGRYAKVDENDPILEESYNRVNTIYFNGLMEKPNLVWGEEAFRKLGHYEYASDRIVISTIFKGEEMLLDYIMYHELLHKKHRNKRTESGRTIHHSRAFREDERKFHVKDAEKKLNDFVRKKRRKGFFSWF